MKAFRIETSALIAPFGGSVGSLTVGGTTLARAQEEALAAAGCELVDTPPTGEPYVLFTDRTWFTPRLIRRLVKAGIGRVHLGDEAWIRWTAPLQEWDEPGVYELAVVEGEPSFRDLQHHDLHVDFHEVELSEVHVSMAHAKPPPVMVASSMAHQVDHWSHLVRINQLVLAARLEEAREDWSTAGFLGRAWQIIKVLLRSKSLNGFKIARAMNEVGKDVSIHPTAVVEFSRLADGVSIGPHAVVRGSILGPGAVVDTHGVVNASCLSSGAKVGRQAHVNLCCLARGAMVSAGDGHQASVFGEDAFVAWGATLMDLSFGSTIKVESNSQDSVMVDSQTHFLGVAVGHRTKIGHGVKIGYGVSVPNDAFLVADGPLLKAWGDAPVGAPAVVRSGRAQAKD